MKNKNIIVGIDPGKQGGIFMLYEANGKETIYTCWAMPTVGKEIDIVGLADILSRIEDLAVEYKVEMFVFLEQVHAIAGASASTTWEFSGSYHLVIGIVAGLRLPLIKVPPKQWQKKVWQGVRIQTKRVQGKVKVDTKATSTLAVKSLMPDVDLRRTERCTTDHDGLADAAAIAYFGKYFHFSSE